MHEIGYSFKIRNQQLRLKTPRLSEMIALNRKAESSHGMREDHDITRTDCVVTVRAHSLGCDTCPKPTK